MLLFSYKNVLVWCHSTIFNSKTDQTLQVRQYFYMFYISAAFIISATTLLVSVNQMIFHSVLFFFVLFLFAFFAVIVVVFLSMNGFLAFDFYSIFSSLISQLSIHNLSYSSKYTFSLSLNSGQALFIFDLEPGVISLSRDWIVLI